MDHGRVCPHSLKEVIGILREAGGISLTEIAVFCVIGGGFPNIVDTGPDELPQGKWIVPVITEHSGKILGAPAGFAVEKGRALQIFIGEDVFLHGEMIDSAALNQGPGFAAVDNPVRMAGMMVLIIFFRVIITGDFNNIRAVLRPCPGHIIAAEGDRCLPDIVPVNLLHKLFRPEEAAL